jgi:ubiquinone/menaquinone biosynthesis C-methylase UbiE
LVYAPDSKSGVRKDMSVRVRPPAPTYLKIPIEAEAGVSPLIKLAFTRDPMYFDEFEQPCFHPEQTKGLIEFQRNELLNDALNDGYTAEVARILKNWVREQISATSAGRKLNLLEIGGGAGDFFDEVKDLTAEYVNIEPGQTPLANKDLERLKDPGYMCIKCSAEQIPLRAESFDIVLAIASFDHVPNYRDALREVSRLLTKGGLFIVTLNNRRSWWKVLLSNSSYLKAREEEIAREHYFQWSFSECEAHLKEIIPVREMETITFIPFIPYAWRYMLPVSDFVGKSVLSRFGANILAVCEK